MPRRHCEICKKPGQFGNPIVVDPVCGGDLCERCIEMLVAFEYDPDRLRRAAEILGVGQEAAEILGGGADG
jgi:hypothetical protein